MRRDRDVIRKMAALLRQGATMLDATCPTCGVPLFRLKSGEVICPKCGQRFLLVGSEEEEVTARTRIVLQNLESVIARKLGGLALTMETTDDPSRLAEIGETMSTLLALIEKARLLRGIGEKAGSGFDNEESKD